MKSYKIVIEATKTGTYTADSLEEAQEIADAEATNAYNRLNGRYSVEVVSVEEVE